MSGSLVGQLKVSLGLDSSKFEHGTRSVKSSLNQMKLQFMAVAGAASLAVAGLSALAMKGSAGIDKVAKDSRRLGSSVLGVRTIGMAAGEAGVAVETLTDALQTMDRELAKNSKAAVGALGRLGIAVADLDGKDADQKLALIADRVKSLGLSTGEASAILQGLGIRNREMILAVMSGGDALRAARADVESYGLALTSVETDKIEAANDAIGRLGLIGQYVSEQLALALVPTFGQLAQAMTDSLREGGLLRGAIDLLVGSLERLGTYLAVAVTGFGVRYVAAVVAAKLATFTLAGALTFLRGALIRTGIGALVVGAGELVYQFMKLVQGAGGFGNAMGILKDLVVEAWDRMSKQAASNMAHMNASWEGFKATMLDGAQRIVEAHYTIGNTIVGVFQGSYDAIKAIWGALPGTIADFAYQAANGLIGGVEAMLNAVVSRINTFIGGMNSALAMLPDWATGGGVKIGTIGDVSLGGIANPFAGKAAEAGTAAGAAFNAALSKEYAKAPNIFGGAASDARGKSSAYTEAAGMLSDAAAKPLPAWQRLKDAITGTTDELGEASGAATGLGDALDDVGGGGDGGGKGGAALDKLKEKAEALKEKFAEVKSAMSNAFVGLVTGAKSLKSAIGELLSKFAEMLASSAFEALWGGKSGKGGLGGLIGKIFGYANGTQNAAGGLSWVGERGPELVNLPRGSQVFDAQRSASIARGAGGGAVQVIGGDLTLTDSGAIMARVKVVAANTTQAGLTYYDRWSASPRAGKGFG